MPDSDNPHQGWYVYSTALKEGWLMLMNDVTRSTGTVRDPTKEEWARAFTAMSDPYPWDDVSRIVVDPRCESEPMQCRFCGCTEADCSQCIERTGNPCSWVASELCSACLAMAEKLTEDMGAHVRYDFGKRKEEPPSLAEYSIEELLAAAHVLMFYDCQQPPDAEGKRTSHKLVAERLAAALYTMTAHKDALPPEDGEVSQIVLCRDKRHTLVLFRIPEEKMIITLPEFKAAQSKRSGLIRPQ